MFLLQLEKNDSCNILIFISIYSVMVDYTVYGFFFAHVKMSCNWYLIENTVRARYLFGRKTCRQNCSNLITPRTRLLYITAAGDHHRKNIFCRRSRDEIILISYILSLKNRNIIVTRYYSDSARGQYYNNIMMSCLFE